MLDFRLGFQKGEEERQLQAFDSQIKRLAQLRDKANDSGEIFEADKIQFQIDDAELKKAEKLTEFAQKRLDIIRESADGQRIIFESLQSGGIEDAIAREAARSSIIKQQIGLYQESIFLQEKLATVGQDASIRYQNAWLNAILQIKEANIQAVESQIESQVRLADSAVLHTEQLRARVLSHLAEQKTLSESFADGIISSFEKLTGFLNKSLGAVGDIPILGDLAKFANQSFSSKLTTGFLDAFFPPEIKELFNKEKNPIAAPIVDKLSETNRILTTIAVSSGGGSAAGGLLPTIPGAGNVLRNLIGLGGGFGSGGGIGGTPNFNSGSGGFNLNSLVGLLSGASGGSVIGQPRGVLGDIRGQFGLGGSSGASSNPFANLLNLFSNKPGGIFAPIAAKGGTTSKLGGYLSGAGSLISLIGGFIPGKAGSVLGAVGSGLGAGATIGSFILPGIGTAIGAAIGAGVGFLASIFGSPKQKEDKNKNLPALQSGFQDALKQLRELAANKNYIQQNPREAVTQGESLVAQISSGFGISFLSSKYQKIAKQQIAAKTTEAKSLLQTIRDFAKLSERAELRPIVAEFADGGMVSKFIRSSGLAKQFSGLVPGVYDRKDDKIIAVTGNEVVLKPDVWQPIAPYLKERKVPGFADGGSVGRVAPVSIGGGETYINIYLEGDLITARVRDVTVQTLGSEKGRNVTKENIRLLNLNGEVMGVKVR